MLHNIYGGDWSTVVCIASGPSLTDEQIYHVLREHNARVICVNRSFEKVPFADIVFAADRRFWNNYYKECEKQCDEHTRFVTIKGSSRTENVIEMPFEKKLGLGKDCLYYCGNSGVMAINLAYLLGAKKIILIGYDFQHTNGKAHFHPDYDKKKFPANALVSPRWFEGINAIAKDIEIEGIDLVNCSIDTSITSIRRSSLNKELKLYGTEQKTETCI